MTQPGDRTDAEAPATASDDTDQCRRSASGDLSEHPNPEALRHFTNDVITPRPLIENVRGTLTIHFTAGGTISRRCSQDFAERTIGMWRDWDPADPNGDEWVWSDHGTFVVRSDQVGAMGFVRSQRAGWWDGPADLKQALITNGYDHGIIEPIINLYTGTDEPPMFSLAALYLIQDIAALPGVTHDTVCDVIGRLEGADGGKVHRTRAAFGFYSRRPRVDVQNGDPDSKASGESGNPTATPDGPMGQPDKADDDER